MMVTKLIAVAISQYMGKRIRNFDVILWEMDPRWRFGGYE
jgi:hypothetical protein